MSSGRASVALPAAGLAVSARLSMGVVCATNRAWLRQAFLFTIVVWPDSHYCSGMKPNYQYEKRQRELEKKKKKAEKEHRKAVANETPPAPETVIPQDTTPDKS